MKVANKGSVSTETRILDQGGDAIIVSADLSDHPGSVYLECPGKQYWYSFNARQARDVIDAIRRAAKETGVDL